MCKNSNLSVPCSGPYLEDISSRAFWYGSTFPSMAFKFVNKTGMFICVFTELRDFNCNKSQINLHSIAGLGSRINQSRIKLLIYLLIPSFIHFL